jgi:hypothetical protein
MRQTFVLLIVAILFAVGCESAPKQPTTSSPPPQLPGGASIYIRLPEKFRTKKEKDDYIDSGGRTADALQSAFLKHTRVVYVSKDPIPLEAALAAAAARRSQYLVFPIIENWEDHYTEWTGVRDRLTLRIRLYEVASGGMIYENVFSEKGRWMTDGGDAPQDLLPRIANSFVNSLFQIQYTPSALR